MTTFFFHVGMDKTGSTSVQKWFATHRYKPTLSGLVYSNLPHGNHSPFIRAQFGAPREKIDASLVRHGNAVFIRDRAAMRERFLAEMKANAAAGLDELLSAETGSTLTAAGHKEMRDLVLQAHGRMVAIALVRPPRSFIRSKTHQMLQHGGTVAGYMEEPPALFLAGRATTLQRVYGEDARLRLFHRDLLVEGDVLQTVVAAMGVPRPSLAEERAERANESMTLTGAKLCAALNDAQAAKSFAAIPEPLRWMVAASPLAPFLRRAFAAEAPFTRYPNGLLQLFRGLPGPPFRLPREMAERVAPRVEHQQRALATVMGIDVARYDDPPETDGLDLAAFRTLSDDEADAIAKALSEASDIAAVADREGEERDRKVAQWVDAGADADDAAG